MTAQRILLINEDGTATVGGVLCKLVPVEPTEAMIRANLDCQDYDPEDPAESEVYFLYQAMLSAAAIDLSGLPRVPDHAVSAFKLALDAMGVKG